MLKLDIIRNEKEETYNLSFTRRNVVVIESMGFDLLHCDAKTVTTLSLLFYGSLLKEYPKMTFPESESILDSVLENGYEVNDLVPNLIEELQNVFTQSGEKKKVQVIR